MLPEVLKPSFSDKNEPKPSLNLEMLQPGFQHQTISKKTMRWGWQSSKLF